jgi:V8-like Glu-specific endopeptidase
MAGDPTSTLPYDCVVLIESPDPLEPWYYLEGSGVVIGPHTILTASHVVFDISEQTPDSDIVLYPGWNSADPALGPGYILTNYTDHFNDIGTVSDDELTKAQSALDYAVIDTSYTFSNWMDVVLDYSGSQVQMTGYPETAGGEQIDQVGTVSADPNYSVLDYGTIAPQPGDSGGPIWLDYGGSDDVAGIVSTTSYACQLTASDWSQIESWVSEDGYTLGTPVMADPLPGLASDILWRNTNGDTELWNPNGSGGFTYENLGIVNTSWQIQGTGDFTGNGEDGILWRNTNGDTELWNPNGSGGFTYENLGIVNTSWQIQGTGDFTGNGEDGMLWRNTDGDTELWSPNGSGGFTYDNLGVVDSSWTIFKHG